MHASPLTCTRRSTPSLQATAFLPKLEDSLQQLQQRALTQAVAAAATSRAMEEQRRQAIARAEAEGTAGPDNKCVGARPGAAAGARLSLPAVRVALSRGGKRGVSACCPCCAF